jgi:hypothetical protein
LRGRICSEFENRDRDSSSEHLRIGAEKAGRGWTDVDKERVIPAFG